MGRLAALAACAAVAVAGCGGDAETRGTAPSADGATTVATPPARGPQAQRGRRLVAELGCLACHRIGRAGNDVPGPELSSIGYSLPPPAIARALVASPQPMPSYRDVPAADRRALLAYLVTLRGPDRNKRIWGENHRE